MPQEIANALELGEFLAPDPEAAPADPAFQERLRQQLWTSLQQSGGRSKRRRIGGARSEQSERRKELPNPDRRCGR